MDTSSRLKNYAKTYHYVKYQLNVTLISKNLKRLKLCSIFAIDNHT